MRPVPQSLRFALHPTQHIVILKRTQQLVVAGARFVRAGHDRIDAAERSERTDALPALSRRLAGRFRQLARRASRARTTVVPIAMTRPPRLLQASINAAVEGGMSYGSSSGSSRSRSVSPVEEMPAAWVRRGERRAARAQRADRGPVEDEPR